MNTTHMRRLLKKGHTGKFRLLKPGEFTQPCDIAIYDCHVESCADNPIPTPVGPKETILRLEFEDTKL